MRSEMNLQLQSGKEKWMATAPQAKPNGRLVDLDQGEISREVFVSEEIYRKELEQVFAQSWLFVGHDGSQRASRTGSGSGPSALRSKRVAGEGPGGQRP